MGGIDLVIKSHGSCIMSKPISLLKSFLICLALFPATLSAQLEPEALKVLFIGKSYTGRHNLSEFFEALAEEGNPRLDFESTAFLYGGRKLHNHWNLGTQNIVRINSITESEQRATIVRIEEILARDLDWTYAKAALR